MLGELAGEADCGDHGGGIGEVFSGDGKGGAVVRAGAGFWQAEGDVYGVVEIEQFERDEPLIVIHGDHCVELAACGIAEDGIGHAGAGEDGGSGFIEALDGGGDDADFFVAKGTVFPGVGVESGDGDARLGDTSAFQKIGGEQTGAHDAIDAEERGDGGECFMDRGQADGQGGTGEQHAEVSDTECVGKILSLAREGETEGLEGLLGDWTGDNGVGSVLFKHFDRLMQGVHGGCCGLGVWFSGSPRAAISEHGEFEAGWQGPAAESLINHLRTDSGGISHGDDDAAHDGASNGGGILPSRESSRFNLVSRGFDFSLGLSGGGSSHYDPPHVEIWCSNCGAADDVLFADPLWADVNGVREFGWPDGGGAGCGDCE